MAVGADVNRVAMNRQEHKATVNRAQPGERGRPGDGLWTDERDVPMLKVTADCLPIAVAHGEGFADFSQRGDAAKVHAVMRFVDHFGNATDAYPANPNGSVGGLTAVTTGDGRFTALMPHAERVFRRAQLSWSADGAGAGDAWSGMFRSARRALA